MEEQIWYDLKGFEDKYQITKTGLIKRKPRIAKRNGYGDLPVKEKLLKLQIMDGYYNIGLRVCVGKSKSFRVHRLMAETFISNPNNLKFVNHKNFNTLDNRLENLEWISMEDNNNHAITNGRMSKKLNNEKVKEILDKFFNQNIEITQICKEYNTVHKTISLIVNGHTWKHLSSQYHNTDKNFSEVIIPTLYKLWKPIEELDGRYEVSNYGEVVKKENKDDITFNHKYEKPKKSESYLMLTLEGQQYYIHNLVAKAFVDNPNNLPIPHHIDHNKQNNRAWNLQWVTQSFNIKAAIAAGRFKRYKGTENVRSKLIKEQVLEIRVMYAKGITHRKIAKLFGIANTTCHSIVKRKTYTEI